VAVAVVIAYGHGAAVVVALPAMVLFLVTCAASARALSTIMATGLRSRKGRDAVAFGGAFVFLALQALRFVDFGAISPRVLERVGNDLRWFPPAMLGQAVIDADHGRWALAGVELIPSIILIGLALQGWAWALKRSTVVVSGGQTSTKPVVVAAGALPLLFRRLPFVRATPWGAVAAKELHYAKRDPRRKIQLFNSAVIGVGLPVGIAIKSGAIGPRSVLLTTLVGYVLILNALNQFGADGGALWVHIVSGDTVRDTLRTLV
jgi:ABC-2 type transport system permease protein